MSRKMLRIGVGFAERIFKENMGDDLGEVETIC